MSQKKETRGRPRLTEEEKKQRLENKKAKRKVKAEKIKKEFGVIEHDRSKIVSTGLGRPKIPLSILPEGWQKTLIEIGAQGGSAVEMQDWLDISEELWDRWMVEEEEFNRTIKRARRKCQIWWEKTGREGCFMGGRENPFNATVWIFNMKNRFKWADRIESNNNLSLTDELKDISDKLPD